MTDQVPQDEQYVPSADVNGLNRILRLANQETIQTVVKLDQENQQLRAENERYREEHGPLNGSDPA